MTAKNVRNLILTLIILAIGVKLILWIAGLGDLAMYGLILLAILLIPYYLSKRSQERKRSGY